MKNRFNPDFSSVTGGFFYGNIAELPVHFMPKRSDRVVKIMGIYLVLAFLVYSMIGWHRFSVPAGCDITARRTD
jgi:hypothetical protein